jgi:hypothetical protein
MAEIVGLLLGQNVGQMFVGFITSGLAVTVALGGGVPWFRIAVAVCVWALATALMWRHEL